MKFRTEIQAPNLKFKIDHSKKGLSLGSCFADNIASKLSRVKFSLCANPFGTLYNPASICQCLERLSCGKEFTQDELFCFNGLFHSELHHGDFSSEDKIKTLDKINANYIKGVKELKECEYIIITLGSAWVYKNAETHSIVSNCHKRPERDFTREKLSVEQIVNMFSNLLDGTLKDKDIILTVSPIRHIKDGLEQNSLSKSTLIVASHELCEKYAGRVHYFPSFEIVNDDLRDYRFYKSDMLHPSDQAVEYVWEKFSQSVFSEQTTKTIAQIQTIARASEHRVLKPESNAHKQFCHSMLDKIAVIKHSNPQIDLSQNEQYFASFLKISDKTD